MLLTPTYHVFDMYKVHQDATMLPTVVKCGTYSRLNKKLDAVSVSASKDKDGKVHISFVNIDPTNAIDIDCNIRGLKDGKLNNVNIITATNTDSHNTFENPDVVHLEDYKGAIYKNGTLTLKMPAKSLITVELNH
ncbi:alpha-L-arabinofuranosidase [Dysgonomonas alginatilytica]|uniref:Alpha-L-arabinofuranosidase n=1 Tax=Dysgonomonas alginatilytica TaxID=1605892 RepID=A0A2V3PJA0_9BACT|nr:alpha-L-arabinofuranosidase [Dysgonomonas alginatilytica]